MWSKYLLIVLLAVALLAGCGETESMKERARAERINAEAERVAAEAAREEAIAEQLRYTEETERLRVLADTASPPYGLMFAGMVVLVVAWIVREHIRTQALIALEERRQAPRLLPGDPDFEAALLDYARQLGVRPVRDRVQCRYYLPTPDGGREEVKSLTKQ